MHAIMKFDLQNEMCREKLGIMVSRFPREKSTTRGSEV